MLKPAVILEPAVMLAKEASRHKIGTYLVTAKCIERRHQKK